MFLGQRPGVVARAHHHHGRLRGRGRHAGAATATGADWGKLGVALGAGLGAGVLAAAGRAGSDGREAPASGPSQPTVIATVATRWRARRWIGPTAATRDASRPRTSAMISATRQATNTTHATHSATVNAPMIAESDATAPGRSRSWSREGRPVMGQWPQATSAQGTATTSPTSAAAAPAPRSQRPADMDAVGELMVHAPG